MEKKAEKRRYHSTESKYKGGADEMYVAYEIQLKTRGDGHAMYPKVKRVYIAGDVKDWKVGQVKTRTGREVYGLLIEYKQSRKGYHRKGYKAKRGASTYQVKPASVKPSSQKFMKVVEVPKEARNIHFYPNESKLPEKYHQALQRVR